MPDLSGLFRVVDTECQTLGEQAVCIPFSCQGMLNTMRRYSDA